MSDENPSNFINWSDYLGVNQGQADEMTKKLLGNVDQQGGQLGQLRQSLVQGAQQAGFDGTDQYQGRGADYANAQMSYGTALERLKDPATRQAVMQRQFGSGSALDSAMAGANGQLQQGVDQRSKAEAAGSATSQDLINQKYGDAKKGSALMAGYNQQYAAQKQAERLASEKQAAARRAGADDNRLLSTEDTPAAAFSGMTYQQYRAKRLAAHPDVNAYMNETRADDANRRSGFDRSLLDVGRWWDGVTGNGSDWTETRRDRLKRQLGQQEQQTGKTWGFNSNSDSWGMK